MAARLTAEQRRLRGIPEAAFQGRICDYAALRGWAFYFAPPNRPVNGHVWRIRAGWPDLALVRDRRLVFIEVKAQLGRVSEDQENWLAALAVAGAETYVFRPSDWPEVQRVLK